MAIKKSPGKKNARRFMTTVKYDIHKANPLKSLTRALPKTGGRDAAGHISTRHIGGGHKRLYRKIDFSREKFNIPAKVFSIEYDPNRSAYIARVYYADGVKR